MYTSGHILFIWSTDIWPGFDILAFWGTSRMIQNELATPVRKLLVYIRVDLLTLFWPTNSTRFVGGVRHHPPWLTCHPSSVITDGAREAHNWHYADIVSKNLWSLYLTAALSTTVYASILSLGSLDLIKHEASSAQHAQHIWPQFEISNHRKFSSLKFKAAGSRWTRQTTLDEILCGEGRL